jgi:hypothetical protein
MAANEAAAHDQHTRFVYLSEERSSRTGGHLWREKVIETADGPMHRLLSIDGKPLDSAQSKAEDARIADILRDPSAFRREYQQHSDDQSRATQLLQLFPRAFLLSSAGEENGCVRFAFVPNPKFQPSTYEERVIHAMSGTVSMKQPADRLCTLQAKIMEPVEFGYGFFGRINPGGYVSLERVPVSEGYWKLDRISVHIQGRILMMKTLTQEREVRRYAIAVEPQPLTIAQAAKALTQ